MNARRGFRCLVATVLMASVFAAWPALANASQTALELIEAGRLREAEQLLRTRLAREESPGARDLLGVVLMRQERFTEAREEFEAAVAAAPERPEPRQHLARLLLMTGQEGAGIEQLRIAANLGELERDLAFRLVEAELTSGNPVVAEQLLRSLIERFDSVRALVRLARLLAERSEFAAARDLLQRGLRLAPNSEEVLATYATVSLSAGNPLPAALALEPLVRMHPLSVRYAYLLGVAHLQVGDMVPASEILAEAVRLAPDHALARIARGIALNQQKRFDEALETLETAIRLVPESLEANAALAETEVGLGNLERAERRATRVLRADPEHGIASLIMGMIRLEQGEFEAAREYLEQAVATDPDSPKSHYQLSLAYARLGDLERSREHQELYREALRKMEAELIEIRTRLGTSTGGMQ